MESGFKILTSFGIGLLAGALTGILIAPASGDETRANLSRITNDSIDSFLEQAIKTLHVTRNLLREMNEGRISILTPQSN